MPIPPSSLGAVLVCLSCAPDRGQRL
jgi:hypothetical protein